MKKKIETLARELELGDGTADDYFEYCISSHINGNFGQCKQLFWQMKREDQKSLLKYIDSFQGKMKEIYNFYFELL